VGFFWPTACLGCLWSLCGIGLHADDLLWTVASGLDVAGMRAVLADTGLRSSSSAAGRWRLDGGELKHTIGRIEAVADGFGGQHVSKLL